MWNDEYTREANSVVECYPIPIGGRLCSLCSSNLWWFKISSLSNNFPQISHFQIFCLSAVLLDCSADMLLLMRSLQIRFSWIGLGIDLILKFNAKFDLKWHLKYSFGCSAFMIIYHEFEKQKFRIKRSCVNANNWR